MTTALFQAAPASGAWQLCVAGCLATLGFFLPFSSAGVSLSLAALLVLAALRGRALWRTQPWKKPVMAVGLVLLAYIALHTLWTSGAGGASARAINHYNELLFAPLLLALLQDARQRRVFFRALVAGALALALAHWAAWVDPALAPLLGSRRISAGFALAVCAFLVLMHGRAEARAWGARAIAAFLGLTVLFAVEGRTGHVVLLLLAACAAWVLAPRRWRWPALLAAPLLVFAVALASSVVSGRLQETIATTQPVGPAGPVTSTGIRIELLKLAGDLSRQYALRGAGFAAYPEVHEAAARARYAQDPATVSYLQASWVRVTNPHNEYAMQLVGGGVLALALFLGWLGLALREAAGARAPVGAMLAGASLAFAVGCVFNSMLMDFVEGHFYMALLAWLLAESRDPGRGEPVQRVLVVATRQIGDVLLTTPLVRSVRRRWPQARIEVLGFQGTLGMLAGNPDVDALIETPPHLGWDGLRHWARRLWRRYDLALVADAGDRAHLIGWLAARRRSGIIPEDSGSNWWKRLLLDHAVVASGDRGEVHVVVEKQHLLDPWLPQPAAVVERVVPPKGRPLPADLRAQLRPGAVLVHAPSMWPYKQWPLAHFQALVQGLLAQGRQVLLTGSGSPRDQECVEPLRELADPPRLLDLSGRLDFGQLVTLCEHAALYIGPDTSVSHLAAAAGVPVIAIFGPTNPMRWAPWPAHSAPAAPFRRAALLQQAGNVTILQGGLGCVPCGRAGCEDHRQSRSDCLVDITPERVLEQVLAILGPVKRVNDACAA